MNSPSVTVLVTTYNHEKYIEECLDSLAAQTSHDFEVIITDDASPDSTADVIEAWLTRTGFEARFVRNTTNRGICANRNTALAMTAAPFVCSLSGDDAYLPTRIEHQLRFFAALGPEVCAIFGNTCEVGPDGRDTRTSAIGNWFGQVPPPQGDIFADLLRANFIPAPAVMVRRACLEAVGPYDESLAYEDLDMWLRLARRYSFAYCAEQVTRVRLLNTSMSRSDQWAARMAVSRTTILQKWLAGAVHEKRIAVDSLWRNGKTQAVRGPDRDARRTLRIAARADSRRWFTLLSYVFAIPGSSRLLRGRAKVLGFVAKRRSV